MKVENIKYLGVNIIWKEFKTLNIKWKLSILALTIIFSLDTLILNYGTAANENFKWLWDTSYKEQAWHGWTKSFYNYWYISKITNGITALFGVINVILIANRKITNYFWGILSCLFYGNYAFSAGYTGDALLNIAFYLPMSFIGYQLWLKNYDKEVKINKFKWYYWIYLLIALAIVTTAWYFIIPIIDEWLRSVMFNDNKGYYFAQEFWPHFFDAFTNALGVASTFLMYGRFGQEFILYITKDAIGIIMWSGLFHTAILAFDLSMIINMTAYLLAGISGLYVWTNGFKFTKAKITK